MYLQDDIVFLETYTEGEFIVKILKVFDNKYLWKHITPDYETQYFNKKFMKYFKNHKKIDINEYKEYLL
jgi:hypothetical protein